MLAFSRIRLIGKLLARPFRGPHRSHNRLGLEVLERRDVPSAYWVGDFSTDARDARNWHPYGIDPSANEDLYFYGPGGAPLWDTIDGEMVSRTPGNDCVGLDGYWGTVWVDIEYDGTITLGSNPGAWEVGDPEPSPPSPTPFDGPGVTMVQLYLNAPDATINQFHPLTGEVSALTITGEIPEWAPPLPAALTWYAGTIGGAAGAPTVTVSATTALISATTATSVVLGSNLVFEEEAEAQVENQVNLTGATGIDVLGGSGLTLGTGTAILSAIQAIEDRNTIRISGEHSRLFTGRATTIDLGLWVDGGTAEMQGDATGQALVAFFGPVRQANGAAPVPAIGFPNVSVYMTGGKLIIGEGTTLVTAIRLVVVKGGKLATRVTAGISDHKATIAGDLIVAQGPGPLTEVVICDPSLNPPGVTGFVFGELSVLGTVEWLSGIYRPLINSTGTGLPCVLWHATGEFQIGVAGSPVVPVLGPTSGPVAPPVNFSGNIIGGNNVVRRATPTFQAGNTNWAIELPLSPDKVLSLRRTS